METKAKDPPRVAERSSGMVTSPFDAAVRTLGATMGRRPLLRGLMGTAFGLVAISEHASHVTAKQSKCRGGKIRCGQKCCAKGQACIGGKCRSRAGTCPIKADSCGPSGTVPCNDNEDCGCYQRLQGGVACVQFTLDQGACDQCQTDQDCRDLGFPPGSSCIKDDGDNCNCEADKRGFCGEPCGFKAH
jgi:hypothetical protein